MKRRQHPPSPTLKGAESIEAHPSVSGSARRAPTVNGRTQATWPRSDIVSASPGRKNSQPAEWAELLSAAVERATGTAVAARLGVSEGSIRGWLQGRTPSPASRDRIVEVLSSPPPTSARPRPERPERPPPPSLAKPELTNRDRLAAIVERLEDEIAACDEAVPKNHVASLYSQLQSAVAKLSRLDGEDALTVSAILRSRAWREEVEPVLLAVFREHPAAAKDLAAALKPAAVNERKGGR